MDLSRPDRSDKNSYLPIPAGLWLLQDSIFPRIEETMEHVGSPVIYIIMKGVAPWRNPGGPGLGGMQAKHG